MGKDSGKGGVRYEGKDKGKDWGKVEGGGQECEQERA